MNGKKIDIIREEIDRIDNEILNLLHKRIGYAKEIGIIKKEKQKGKSVVQFRDREREEEIYRRLFIQNRAVLSEESLREIFAAIISACRTVQER